MLQTSFSQSPESSESVATVEFVLEERNCDVCGGSDLEEIWVNEYLSRTRSSRFHFRNRNVVCRRCGFAFVSPCPRDEDLAIYYQDALAHYAGQPPTSDIDARVDTVRRHIPTGLAGLEIGGNQLVRDPRLLTHFATLTHVEPNSEISASYSHIDDVPDNSVDAVLHYYVLEHARDPVKFLRTCRRILRRGGFMICEVPDMKLYSKLMGEYLFPEHLTHFSAVSLARLAGAAGFRLIELEHRRCSNPRGMSAIFVREDSDEVRLFSTVDQVEYLDARTAMRDGLAVVDDFNALLEETRRQIAAASTPVTIWGANPIVERLLAPLDGLPPQAIIVDDDPRKANYLVGTRVLMPATVKDHIAKSELLVISSARLDRRILARARDLIGPSYSPTVRVIDYDLSIVN